MIELTRLGGSRVIVNADLILTIEQTPDTLVGLANGETLLVRETPEQVVALVIDYRRRCGGSLYPRELVAPSALAPQS